jgi:hypothetical protein
MVMAISSHGVAAAVVVFILHALKFQDCDAMNAFNSNFEDTEYPKPDWPHDTVFVQPGSQMIDELGISSQPLPLGVPFGVNTTLFEGAVMLRFRNSKSNDMKAHSSYFLGRKRLMQVVIQGRFKRRISMSEVYVGSLFTKPFKFPPPVFVTKIVDTILRPIAPGLILNLSSRSPMVLALLAGTVQTMSIDPLGEEPDITLPVINENVASVLGQSVGSISKRMKVLGNPKKAKSFYFETEHVYTFHTYDNVMDYGRGTMHIPMFGEYDIKPSIGHQPLSWTGVTRDGGILFDMRIWHRNDDMHGRH